MCVFCFDFFRLLQTSLCHLMGVCRALAARAACWWLDASCVDARTSAPRVPRSADCQEEERCCGVVRAERGLWCFVVFSFCVLTWLWEVSNGACRRQASCFAAAVGFGSREKVDQDRDRAPHVLCVVRAAPVLELIVELGIGDGTRDTAVRCCRQCG